MTKSLEVLRTQSKFMDATARDKGLELIDNYIGELEGSLREMREYRKRFDTAYDADLNGDTDCFGSPGNVLGWATSALRNVLANCRFDLLGSRCVEIDTARRLREELQQATKEQVR